MAYYGDLTRHEVSLASWSEWDDDGIVELYSLAGELIRRRVYHGRYRRAMALLQALSWERQLKLQAVVHRGFEDRESDYGSECED
jgi:hypothetical protein